MNLVSNAVKFTKSGGSVTITCQIVSDRSEFLIQDEAFLGLWKPGQQMIEVQVKDTGVGISEEDQKKLFKLFGFLEATREINTSGIGLGLHISKQIVQQYGGDIICQSEKNKGTNFAFVMALDKVEDRIEQVTRSKNPNPFKRVYMPIKIDLRKPKEHVAKIPIIDIKPTIKESNNSLISSKAIKLQL